MYAYDSLFRIIAGKAAELELEALRDQLSTVQVDPTVTPPCPTHFIILKIRQALSPAPVISS